MKYSFRNLGVETDEQLSLVIQKRFNTLERLVGQDGYLNIELVKEVKQSTPFYVIDATLDIPSKGFKARAMAPDLLTAVDEVKGRLLAEYKKSKERRLGYGRRILRKFKESFKNLWPGK